MGFIAAGTATLASPCGGRAGIGRSDIAYHLVMAPLRKGAVAVRRLGDTESLRRFVAPLICKEDCCTGACSQGFGVIANAAKRSAAIFLVFYGILFALFGKTIDCTTSVLILNCRMQNHWRTMCARFSFVQACSALGVTLTG